MAGKRQTTSANNTQLDLACELFFTAKQAEALSPGTLETYRAALTRFVSWLDAEGVNTPTAITTQLVRRYIVSLGSKGYTTSYVHGLIRPVKTWLRFLYAEDVLQVDVMARVAMPKTDTPVLAAFTAQQVKQLLAACEDAQDPVRDRAVVLVLLDTGVRAQEFCDLTIGDVDTKTGAVIVRRGKGGKGRIVYLGAASRKALVRYLLTRSTSDKAAPLFPSHQTTQHMTVDGIRLLCRRLGQRSGVPNCNPHTFRRTFAIFSLRAGCDLARLALLMGHSGTQVLARYLPFVEADGKEAHDLYGPVDALMGKGGKR